MNLTDRHRQLIKMENLHRCRRRAIRRRLKKGMSFSAAEAATHHVFDSVGWHEVVSRLRRARGMIHGMARMLTDGNVPNSQDAGFGLEVRKLAHDVAVEAKSLAEIMATVQAMPGAKGIRQKRKIAARSYETMTNFRNAFVLGQLKAARSFIIKCRRNAPYVEARGAAMMTTEERFIIEREIREIRRGAGRLKRAIHCAGERAA